MPLLEVELAEAEDGLDDVFGLKDDGRLSFGGTFVLFWGVKEALLVDRVSLRLDSQICRF